MVSFKILRRIFNLIGLTKNDSHPFPNKGGWPGLRILPKVDNLIDVGIGHQGTEGLYRFFPDARKFFIDPLAETREAVALHLKDTKNKFMEYAVSSEVGTLEINVREPISQSGFQESEHDETKKLTKRKVKVETLDRLFPVETLNDTWGLKIDVEGHEKEVLYGGEDLIKHCSFVIVEVSISGDRFKGAASFEEIVIFMAKLGLKVATIRVSKDGIDHCDMAFVRSNAHGE